MKTANLFGLPQDVIEQIAFTIGRELRLEDTPEQDVQIYMHHLANEWRIANGLAAEEMKLTT